MKKKEICPASGNCQKQFLKGEVTCKTCRRRKRDMVPKTGKETVPSPPPDETDWEEDTVTDAFGNTGFRFWTVQMEFTHDYGDGEKARITFGLTVAGDDEEDARVNAETVDLEDIIPDVDTEECDPDDLVAALNDAEDVSDADWEDWSDEDDDWTIELRADPKADVEPVED